jgi:hypothetical protein
MPRRIPRACWPAVLLLIAGCGAPPSQKGTAAVEDGELKEAFTAYQKALRDKNADRLWDMLSTQARADADRVTQQLRGTFVRANAEVKAKLAKDLGLTMSEMTNLTAKDYLRTPRFVGAKPQDEIPKSKFEGAAIEGEKATVKYVEPDDHKKELRFVREGKRWKVSPAFE